MEQGEHHLFASQNIQLFAEKFDFDSIPLKHRTLLMGKTL